MLAGVFLLKSDSKLLLPSPPAQLLWTAQAGEVALEELRAEGKLCKASLLTPLTVLIWLRGTAGVWAWTWALASRTGTRAKESRSSYFPGGVLSHASAGSPPWYDEWLSPLPAGLTDLRERRAGAQLVEPRLSYSLSDDPVAFVEKCAQPLGWKGWTPLADLSRGTDADKQGPSLGKVVEDG